MLQENADGRVQRSRGLGVKEIVMRECVQCGSTDLFEMDLTVGDQPARFVHCRGCEHRFWTRDDDAGVLALSEVLAG